MNFFRGIYRFDYMGHKKWWFAISACVIGVGLAGLFIRGDGNPVQGLNYGLEFRQGTRITVVFDRQPTLEDVRRVVAKAGYVDAQIQETESAGGTDVRGYQIQTKTLSPAEQSRVRESLDSAFVIARPGGDELFGLETVGATFGREVASSSIKAVGLAVLLILIYVTIRFQWKFAVGAVAAVVHDLLVVIGVYALTGRSVTTATIAAVLTILGYSLYDNVIIFDRVRENQPKLARLPYGDMVNVSIWETMTRSLNTTFIVVLPVLCLLLFGGVTLKDFAFALLVGILSGAYSSFFVACPVLTLLKEREPQNRRLKAAARTDQS